MYSRIQQKGKVLEERRKRSTVESQESLKCNLLKTESNPFILLQPMIQYINHKDIYGPFAKKADVYLPHRAEVTSAKFTNM